MVASGLEVSYLVLIPFSCSLCNNRCQTFYQLSQQLHSLCSLKLGTAPWDFMVNEKSVEVVCIISAF